MLTDVSNTHYAGNPYLTLAASITDAKRILLPPCRYFWAWTVYVEASQGNETERADKEGSNLAGEGGGAAGRDVTGETRPGPRRRRRRPAGRGVTGVGEE
jgi:hypothetical protein